MLKNFVFILFALFLFIIPIQGVSAQSRRGTVYGDLSLNGRKINSLVFQIDGLVKPGEVIEGSFNVRNEYEESNDVQIVINPKNFTQGESSGSPQFLDEELPYISSLADWIQTDSVEFDISGYGQSRTVNFRITVPLDAEPGSKSAGILMQRLLPGQSAEDAINGAGAEFSINAQIGPLVLLTVDGELFTDVSTSPIKTSNVYGNNDTIIPGLYFQQPVVLHFEMQNKGNINIAPRGKVYVTRSGERFFENPIDQFDLNPVEDGDRDIILPFTSRVFEFQWNNGFITLDQAKKEATGETYYARNYNFNKLTEFRLGQYEFTVQYDYIDEDGIAVKTETSSVSFWIIPWDILVLLLTIIVYIIYKAQTLKRQR